MKKIIYIFRHGETNFNKQKRFQGWLDVPLNKEGVAQAHELARKISDMKFDCVYSSSLSRALDTAKILIADQDIKVIANDDLREWNLGDLSGKIVRISDMPIDTPIDFNADIIYVPFALMSNDDYVLPNGESYNMFAERVCGAIKDIVNKTDGKNIAIVAHGGVAKVLIKSLTNVHWSRIGMPNAGFFKLEYDGKKFSMPEIPDWLSCSQQMSLVTDVAKKVR